MHEKTVFLGALAWLFSMTEAAVYHDPAYTIWYTGEALGQLDDGSYAMIPVSECEFGCAMGDICGTEETCRTGTIIPIVFFSIAGIIALVCICCCCNVFIKSRQVSNDFADIYAEENKQPLVQKQP